MFEKQGFKKPGHDDQDHACQDKKDKNEDKQFIYLDHACTAHPKPSCVGEAIVDYLQNIGVSPSRSFTSQSEIAQNKILAVRKGMQTLLGAENLYQSFFTLNATHAANIILKGFLQENDHVLATACCHNAILRPLETLKKQKNIQYTIIPADSLGRICLEAIEEKIQKNTKLLIAPHISNVTGCIAPLEALSKIAKQHEICFFVDAAQSAGLLEIDVEKLGIDFLVFTGHKHLLGPSGVGGGYIKNPMLVESLYEGGTGSNSLSLVHPQTPPIKFEAGTENYLGIVGLGASIKFLQETGLKNIQQKIFALTQYCRKKLQEIPHLKIFGDDASISVVSFVLENISPPEISYFLDRECHILTRAGILCAPLIHAYLNTLPEGVIRCSFGYTTTQKEIDLLCQSLKQFVQRGKSYATQAYSRSNS